MNAVAVVVEGTVQPNGTLEVTEKVDLPPGRVQVTVQPVAEPVQPDRFWKMMESVIIKTSHSAWSLLSGRLLGPFLNRR
jgi:hypothetical protein